MDEAGADPDKPPQGWFVDPFGRHEHRWFSQGHPTGLVRDGRREGQDPAPDLPLRGPMVPAAGVTRPTRPEGDIRSVHDSASGAGPGGSDTGARPPPTRPPTGRPPPTPARVVRIRWIALAGGVVWAALVALQFSTAATTVTTSPGHVRTEPVSTADPGAVVGLVGLLVVVIAVTGIDLVVRLRSGTERASRPGYVCAAVLAVLGILSLATVGLALLLLGFLLVVVARPMRRPRPVPGERVVP